MNPNHSSASVDYSSLYDDVDAYFGVHDSYQSHHASSFNHDVMEQHHHHQRSMMMPACVYNMTMSSNLDSATGTTTAATTTASTVQTFPQRIFSDKINGPFIDGILPSSSSSLFFTPEDQFGEFNLPFEFLGDNFD
jgi:hypothetical protein